MKIVNTLLLTVDKISSSFIGMTALNAEKIPIVETHGSVSLRFSTGGNESSELGVIPNEARKTRTKYG